jgi:glycerophosphoryl diester phosphodiesterase
MVQVLHFFGWFCTFGCLLGACTSGNKKIEWQGHRGARGVLPENTVLAFAHALEQAAISTLEMDVVISKDGQVVLSHEPWFSHEITTKPDGTYVTEAEEHELNLYSMTLDSIKRYDVGLKPHPRFDRQKKLAATKPTLNEVVAMAKTHARGSTILYNIEIKSAPEYDRVFTPPVEEFAQIVAEKVIALGIANQANIQSFDVRPLQYLRKTYPQLQLSFLVENTDGFEANLNALGFTPEIYSPAYALVTPALVESCHAKGMRIIPWTVNLDSIAMVLTTMGVDGIITDYPELAR